MIFYKYIFKEILKTQLVILFILLTIFLCQSLVGLVSRAAVGSIPVEIITSLAMCAVPEIAMIMLPLTLFLAVLLTLGRICSDSEMVVLRSVGFSPAVVMKITMVLALLTALMVGINSIYLVPEASRTQNELKADAKNNPQFLPIESGRFVSLGERFTVYIDEVEDKDGEKSVDHIYVMDTPFAKDRGSITTAKSGYLQTDEDGVRWLYLFDGQRYEGTLAEGSFRRINFSEFRAPVTRDSEQTAEDTSKNSISTWDLLHSDITEYQVEAQWRISSLLAVLVLTMAAVPLSMVNPRQGRFAKLMPALLIFASYYMFLLSVRNLINHGNFPLYPGLYTVPVLFFLFVCIPLNLPRSYVKRLLQAENSKNASASASEAKPEEGDSKEVEVQPENGAVAESISPAPEETKPQQDGTDPNKEEGR
ncbi:MAG: LPS export ABC transporter permease LptF [Proteobacteria bacterium]|uniref:Lipopolysaccharide export system permease protein LptF n=1 Tax=Candidatus Avisuccinivibrio stercorigallinarum TaxID=2840704 RepID=A0A9D9DB75_9GAMM|nr:LPS export ABC transporter permease LptF [Candidatus Avisuccinivibrio stercorigallinarum]